MKSVIHLKRLITLSVMLVLVAITPVFASDNDEAGNAMLSKTISKQLSLPSSLVKPDFNAEVKVDFKVKDDGSVEVIRIHTNNLQLKDHVMKQFSRMHVDEANIDTQKVYRIPVKYRVI